MSQSLVTAAAPLAVARIPDAIAAIALLGNRAAPGLAAALNRLDGDDGVHFVSLHAIPPTNEASVRGHLVLEFSADGAETDALARVVSRIGPQLVQIFKIAEDWKGGDLLG